jgi:hypothetical protein
VRLHQATDTSLAPTGGRPVTVIDMGTALDLLAAAVRHRGAEFIYQPVWVEEPRYLTCRYATGGAPDCIVGHALAYAGIDIAVLEALNDDVVEDLYIQGRFPCSVTLGALAVLRRAQQSQDGGCPWGEVLNHAEATAAKFLDLLPDVAFRLAMRPQA